MQNDPELSGKYLGTISQDFIKVADTLKEASYQMRIRKVSEFPIFPISKIDLPIGKLLIGRTDTSIKWNYNISFLDEFVQREIIAADRIGDFKNAYKDPEEFCCLFVVDVDFTNFLFIPYPED
jgi:hypothetical protein